MIVDTALNRDDIPVYLAHRKQSISRYASAHVQLVQQPLRAFPFGDR
jgi:hypothetical protein